MVQYKTWNVPVYITGVELSLLPPCRGVSEVEYQEQITNSSSNIRQIREHHVFLNRVDMAGTLNMKNTNSSGQWMISHKLVEEQEEELEQTPEEGEIPEPVNLADIVYGSDD